MKLIACAGLSVLVLVGACETQVKPQPAPVSVKTTVDQSDQLETHPLALWAGESFRAGREIKEKAELEAIAIINFAEKDIATNGKNTPSPRRFHRHHQPLLPDHEEEHAQRSNAG